MVRFTMVVALSAIFATAVVACNMQTVVINGQPMVSLAAFGDSFGAAIGYDCGRNGISIALNSCSVVMIPDCQTAWVNGNAVILAAPVVIVDGITYVPVTFLCQAFNLNYNCQSGCQPVIINQCTQQSVVLIFDFNWCNCPHVWCHNFDCRCYRNFRGGPCCGGGFRGNFGCGGCVGPRNTPGNFGGRGFGPGFHGGGGHRR